MRRSVVVSFGSMLVWSVASCGGGSPETSGDLSKNEAETAFDQTSSRTQSGTEEALGTSTFTGGSAAVAKALQDQSVDLSSECSEGGSADISGTMSLPDGTTGESETEMNFAVDFQDCTENGTTVDGNLDYWSLTVQDDAGLELSMSMEGDLTYSGEVEGSCGMNADIQVSMEFPDFEEGGGEFQIDVEESGSFCGYALEELELDSTNPDNFDEV